jgi:hypothetical protein
MIVLAKEEDVLNYRKRYTGIGKITGRKSSEIGANRYWIIKIN